MFLDQSVKDDDPSGPLVTNPVPMRMAYVCEGFHGNCILLWLTHWGRVTHICVGYLAIMGSDNGLSPGRRQAIIWTNAGILLIGPLGTNFSEIYQNSYVIIQENVFENIVWKMAAMLSRPQVHGHAAVTNFMTTMSHERHGIWKHWQLNCLFHSLFLLASN